MSKASIIAEREAAYPCLIGSDTPLNLMKHRYVGGGYKYYWRTGEVNSGKNGPGTAPAKMGCIADADPRLEAMMQTASKFMPSGWQIFNRGGPNQDSAEDPGAGEGILLRRKGGTINHFSGLAIDVCIRTNDGTFLCNVRNHRTFRTYEYLYQLICRLIWGDLISYADGTPCNWGDLVEGKLDKDGLERTQPMLGARRQFVIENGVFKQPLEEYWSVNDNGEEIKNIPDGGKQGPFGFTPRGAPKWGVRWGGYFGNSLYKMKRDLTTKEQLMNHQGPGKIITYIPEQNRWDKGPIEMWDKDTGERMQALKKDKAGNVIVPHEYEPANWPGFDNVGWDSMHYDFRPGDQHSLAGGENTLAIPAENNSTGRDIPVNTKPMSRSAMRAMPLPGTPGDCKVIWEETLGVAPPPGFVAAVVPPPIMGPSERTNEYYNADALRNEMEINARLTSNPTPGGFTDAPLITVPVVTTSTKSKTSQTRERAPSGLYRER